MRIGILRPMPQFSASMDVYTKGLVSGLKAIHSDWELIELSPFLSNGKGNPIITGVKKYYERYWRYPYEIKKQNIDVFHIIDHSDGHLLYWLKHLPQPKIITCHDLINLTQPETFTGRSLLPIVSMKSWKFAVAGMQYADHIVTVSSHTAKDVTQHLNISLEKITTVPNAVDAQFKPLALQEINSFRQHKGLLDQDFCLLNVGSNNVRKNISTILKVVASLKRQNFPIHFWKVGADFNTDQKRFITTQGLTNDITYLGKPSPNELIKIYNAADVLIAPSLYEGFGLTILEAMACGTPVISSNVTSLPEVAGDAAVLVKPTDLNAIVTAIIRLQTETSYRQSLIDKGLIRASQFTWQKTATQVAQIYQKLLTLM
ncbi:MAG: glycosyltransferase [Cyanobacteria bacterium]|nr:glycosyltransferase [Cyanobacteria bacterium GSL.Bin1]